MKTHWHSTSNPKGPSGDIESGTFRDVDLSYLNTAQIDLIDRFCIDNECSRSKAMENLIYIGLGLAPALEKPKLINAEPDEYGRR